MPSLSRYLFTSVGYGQDDDIGRQDKLFALSRSQVYRIIADCATRAKLQEWITYPDGRQ